MDFFMLPWGFDFHQFRRASRASFFRCSSSDVSFVAQDGLPLKACPFDLCVGVSATGLKGSKIVIIFSVGHPF
jgi:hypothetical protein